jgi:hypothetical protein
MNFYFLRFDFLFALLREVFSSVESHWTFLLQSSIVCLHHIQDYDLIFFSAFTWMKPSLAFTYSVLNLTIYKIIMVCCLL